MSSLKACIKPTGKGITPQERKVIDLLTQKYRDKGYNPHEAEFSALTEILDHVRENIAKMESSVKEEVAALSTEQAAKNALQERIAAEVPVPPSPADGQGVGQEVRPPGEPAGARPPPNEPVPRQITPEQEDALIDESIKQAKTTTDDPIGVLKQAAHNLKKLGAQLGEDFAIGWRGQASDIVGLADESDPYTIARRMSDDVEEAKVKAKQWKPLLTHREGIVGGLARWVEGHAMDIENHIGEIHPEAGGVITRAGREEAELHNQFSPQIGKLMEPVRKVLSADEMDVFSNLLQSGKDAEAREFLRDADLARGGRHAKLVGELTGDAFATYRAAFDELFKMTKAWNPKLEYIPNYSPRYVHDMAKFVETLEIKAPDHPALKAMKESVKSAKRNTEGDLTSNEVVEAQNRGLNNYLASTATAKGRPGFTKERTIAVLPKEVMKYLQPADVSAETYLREAIKGYVRAKYFGQLRGEESNVWAHPENITAGGGGTMGDVLRRGLASGEIGPEGFRQIVRDVETYVGKRDPKSFEGHEAWRLLNAGLHVRLLTGLESLTNQYQDIGTNIYKYNPLNAAEGYVRAHTQHAIELLQKLGLQLKHEPSIGVTMSRAGIHEGNPDVLHHGRGSKWWENAASAAQATTVGVGDVVNKSGGLTAAWLHLKRAAMDPNSPPWSEIETRYSRMYPEQWGEIKKSLQSREFQKMDFDHNSLLILFSELARNQPIHRGGRTRGALESGPLMRMLLHFAKAFQFKNLGFLRREIYAEARKGNVAGAGWNLVKLMALQGATAVAVRQLNDWILNRKSNQHTVAVNAVLGMFGMSKFLMDGILGSAPMDRAFTSLFAPLGKMAADFYHDGGILYDWAMKRRWQNGPKAGLRVVSSLKDVYEQSRFVLPIVTHMIPIPAAGAVEQFASSRVGEIAAKEKVKRDREMRGLKPEPDYLDRLEALMHPKDKRYP